VKSTDIIKQIKADGWYLVHVVGSHHQFKHPTKPGKVTVPHPKKDLPLPTVRSILKQAGLQGLFIQGVRSCCTPFMFTLVMRIMRMA
jgi:predicted RNA binding protein YcfA (HicA-like mRNA interferase family)